MARKDSQGAPPEALTYKEGLQGAAALCGRQEQCSGDIRGKLLHWGLSEEDAEKVIVRLRKEKFLDDRRYARFYTRDKLRFNGWGPQKISHMLRQKEVDPEVIREALEEIVDTVWQEKCNELVRSKARGLKENNPFTRKGKLFRFAAGRGFLPEQIHRSLAALEREAE